MSAKDPCPFCAFFSEQFARTSIGDVAMLAYAVGIEGYDLFALDCKHRRRLPEAIAAVHKTARDGQLRPLRGQGAAKPPVGGVQ